MKRHLRVRHNVHQPEVQNPNEQPQHVFTTSSTDSNVIVMAEDTHMEAITVPKQVFSVVFVVSITYGAFSAVTVVIKLVLVNMCVYVPVRVPTVANEP